MSWHIALFRVIRRYPLFFSGLGVVLIVVLFGLIGSAFVDAEGVKVGSAPPDRPPSAKYLLGTDTVGRQMLAVMVEGTPLTLRIGFVAGAIGLGVGLFLGLIAGYYGGMWDFFFRGAADVLLTVPGLLVLVVIASTLKEAISLNTQALVVASLAWMWPTRTIRSQLLALRESGYVHVASLSGMGNPEILFRELVPNLLPYLAASFVGAVASATLASIGLDALGLGPQNEPTLGMTIYWGMYHTAVFRGLWWYWAPPIIILVVLFLGLYLMSAGLDPIANPRLRKSE